MNTKKVTTISKRGLRFISPLHSILVDRRIENHHRRNNDTFWRLDGISHDEQAEWYSKIEAGEFTDQSGNSLILFERRYKKKGRPSTETLPCPLVNEEGKDAFDASFRIGKILEEYRSTPVNVNPDLSAFFHKIYGNLSEETCVYMSVDYGASQLRLRYQDIDMYLHDLTIMSNMDFNLFFCPFIFNGRRDAAHSVSSSVIFTDIDDVPDMDFTELTDDEVIEWLRSEKHVNYESMPDYISCSGHG